MATKGYDVFFPDPDTVEEMKCKVCGTTCDVKRGVEGPTSFAGAMSGSKRKHDRFSCPYDGERWHSQALHIVQEIEASYSPSVRAILQKDLQEVIEKKTVTVK